MVVYSLFDGSGIMGLPWAEAGCRVYCVNADDADHGDYQRYMVKTQHPNLIYINEWIEEWRFPRLERPDIVLAFPPCTDLAVSGSRAFASKRAANPRFQLEATSTARAAEVIGQIYGVPWMVENPVSVLSTLWRKPDAVFHPWEFGGYLPEGDTHPNFPEFIAARDAYPKTTCLWTGGGFIFPEKRPVPVPGGYSTQFKKLGGKSARTKVIRSLTPRGFARAVFEANYRRPHG